MFNSSPDNFPNIPPKEEQPSQETPSLTLAEQVQKFKESPMRYMQEEFNKHLGTLPFTLEERIKIISDALRALKREGPENVLDAEWGAWPILADAYGELLSQNEQGAQKKNIPKKRQSSS